ncbi:MAG: CapA family protein [Acidimicrobiia bacterium]|nr:CapA family protein [Acidimicrobiia bacterium]
MSTRMRSKLALAAALLTACSVGGFSPTPVDLPERRQAIAISDESGDPIEEATFTPIGGGEVVRAVDGILDIPLSQPLAGVIKAPGYLDEPIVVSAETSPDLPVTMWSRVGANGQPRYAMHFGGDTMMGRRFLDPERTDTEAIDPDDPATAVAAVAGISDIIAAADISMVNLETVIGDADTSEATPGKRFLLQSPPVITEALSAMGIDLVTLGNNHAVDWGDAGVVATVAALDGAGIGHVGAGLDDAQARAGTILAANGLQVGVLSYTTVTGSTVNDALVDQEDPAPSDSPWQHVPVELGIGTKGSEVYLPEGQYLPGALWRWFEQLSVGPEEETRIWRILTAAVPYFQDWVARRGHGGAAWFRASAVEADVAEMRARGADVVVVQIHGGYQFSEVGSRFFASAAHASIDAGADLVVGHHPHVLQGFEWYDDTLIAHSLGNLLFDQDFLATFSSVILRTVFEGDTLLEARALPVVLDRYRPKMATGQAAARIIGELRGDSTGLAPTDKHVEVIARTVGANPIGSAELSLEGNAGVVVRARDPYTLTVATDDLGIAQIPPGLLVATDGIAAGVALGRDLLRWGDFDDHLADGDTEGGTHWNLEGSQRAAIVVGDPVEHQLVLRLTPSRSQSALIRPVARVAAVTHRFVDSDGRPTDSNPQLSVRALVKRSGPVRPVVRLDLYHFDDSDPLEEPDSTYIRRVEIPLDSPEAETWVMAEALAPPDTLEAVDGLTPNAIMVYVTMASGTPSVADIDDLKLIEWYVGDDLPAGLWLEADVIRSTRPEVDILVR